MSSQHVFLTRPQGRNGTVPERLRALGIQVHELPALELLPVDTPGPLPAPSGFDLVVFVSRYAVQRYLELLAATPGGPDWPAHTVAATVGVSSAQAFLHAKGVRPASLVHPPADAPAHDSEALLALLLERGVSTKRVLIVRGTQGREWLSSALKARGSEVEILPVYERVGAQWPPETAVALAEALHRPEQCVFLMTSSEGVQAMAGRLAELGLLAQWSKAAFVIIHERIGATLQSVLASQPWGDVARPAHCLPDDDSIVQAILAVIRQAAKP